MDEIEENRHTVNQEAYGGEGLLVISYLTQPHKEVKDFFSANVVCVKISTVTINALKHFKEGLNSSTQPICLTVIAILVSKIIRCRTLQYIFTTSLTKF